MVCINSDSLLLFEFFFVVKNFKFSFLKRALYLLRLGKRVISSNYSRWVNNELFFFVEEMII